jgi:hypothetical protein
VGHTVSEITEQAIDELDEIVTLVGGHNALGLPLLQANGVPDDP